MFAVRIKKELQMLEKDPPPGISAWTEGTSPDGSTRIGACIKGPPDSPFQEGLFALKIVLPPAYPMNPPQVRFETRVYHPNIDEQGRICLDTLKSAPSKAGSSGYWAPSLNLSTVLSTIQLLLANPNPEDGLVREISLEYMSNRAQFYRTAEAYTRRFATQQQLVPPTTTITAATSTTTTTTTTTTTAAVTTTDTAAAATTTATSPSPTTDVETTLSSSLMTTSNPTRPPDVDEPTSGKEAGVIASTTATTAATAAMIKGKRCREADAGNNDEYGDDDDDGGHGNADGKSSEHGMKMSVISTSSASSVSSSTSFSSSSSSPMLQSDSSPPAEPCGEMALLCGEEGMVRPNRRRTLQRQQRPPLSSTSNSALGIG